MTAGTIRTAKDRENWRCHAVTVDIKRENWMKIACRDGAVLVFRDDSLSLQWEVSTYIVVHRPITLGSDRPVTHRIQASLGSLRLP